MTSTRPRQAVSRPRIPAKRAPSGAALLLLEAGIERARAGELQERSESLRLAARQAYAEWRRCERRLRRH